MLKNHPTGLTGVATSLVIIAAERLGLDLGPEDAALIIGVVVAVASKLTPRTIRP